MDSSIASIVPAAGLTRMDKILHRIDRSMKVLEIGPSFSPIAPKAEGWNSFTVDHDDQAGLRDKYKDQNVDISRIEPVDFIWKSDPLDVAIPSAHHGTFDACIASHVIEHLTNPIEILRSLQGILKPDGIISLAVPDKRYCFDYFKPLSMTGDWLYAQSVCRKRHSKQTAFNNIAYSVASEDAIAWTQSTIRRLDFAHTLVEAKKSFDELNESANSAYVDHHAWHYTPSSLRLIILELNVLDVLHWVEDVFFPATDCEFFVTWKRGKIAFASEDALQARRLELLLAMMSDVREQCDYLSPLLADVVGGAASGTLQSKLDRLNATTMELLSRQAEMLLQVDKQGRQLRKIWEVARIARTALWPLRATRRKSMDLYRSRFALLQRCSSLLRGTPH